MTIEEFYKEIEDQLQEELGYQDDSYDDATYASVDFDYTTQSWTSPYKKLTRSYKHLVPLIVTRHSYVSSKITSYVFNEFHTIIRRLHYHP